jgi:two-component system response regulator FixJ
VRRSEKIYLVDDDPAILDALGLCLENAGYDVTPLSAGSDLLHNANAEDRAVVVLDHYLDDMRGLELQAELGKLEIVWPVIFISGSGDIALSVKAMKAGAVDFLEKPVSNEKLLASVESATALLDERDGVRRLRDTAQKKCSRLTEREREVMKHIVSGLSSSQVAERLELSTRTVEAHRSNINKKMGTKTLVELVRLAEHCRSGDPCEKPE